MKVSIAWLREMVEVPADDAAIAARLTAAGLEVEGTTKLGAGVSGIIVGEVRDTRRHPKADKLTLVDVFDGKEVTQVVCGAPNVPGPGGKVVWAKPGATLPGGITLAAKEVRGILSPGMLCAEDELGISDAHAGIILLDGDAVPGSDALAALGLPDTILELNVTPNRPDCLGHLGVARDLYALFPDARMQPLDADIAPLESGDPVEKLARVTLEDAEGCPRYTARVLTGVKVGQSLLRDRLRLQSLGIRAINDVVDATNLALLETGHPLHAFDLDKLAGHAIVVRRAKAGEIIVTLDGQERKLTVEDVAICDGERPVAVAGVMGGRDSEVDEKTTRILLESAHFAGPRVRRTGKRLGLHSEAALRFERGTDPNQGVSLSSLWCARRIAMATGAKIAPGVIDCYPNPPAPARIGLWPNHTDRLIGVEIPAREQQRILLRLGIQMHSDGGLLHCTVPTFRPDLTREVDLIEEIARVHGFDQVPAKLPSGAVAPPSLSPVAGAGEAVRDALSSLGLDETLTFAFVGPDRLAALGSTEEPLRLANPLREEQSAMRTTLLPGLLAQLARNQSRGTFDVQLYELGTQFHRREGSEKATGDAALPTEVVAIAGVMAGRRAGWLKPGEELDFFDAKGVIEALFARRGVAGLGFRAATKDDAPWLHPGIGAAITVAGETVGVVGEIHPEVRAKFDVLGRAFAFELKLSALVDSPIPKAQELPRFPSASRDLSFFVDAGVTAAAISDAVAGAGVVESARVLDDYREAGKVPAGKKSMLWSFTYRAKDRTLTDDEVNRDHARVTDVLRSRFAIEPR
jgi:phenylalanyl-tRNA synthetase beta chain